MADYPTPPPLMGTLDPNQLLGMLGIGPVAEEKRRRDAAIARANEWLQQNGTTPIDEVVRGGQVVPAQGDRPVALRAGKMAPDVESMQILNQLFRGNADVGNVQATTRHTNELSNELAQLRPDRQAAMQAQTGAVRGQESRTAADFARKEDQLKHLQNLLGSGKTPTAQQLALINALGGVDTRMSTELANQAEGLNRSQDAMRTLSRLLGITPEEGAAAGAIPGGVNAALEATRFDPNQAIQNTQELQTELQGLPRGADGRVIPAYAERERQILSLLGPNRGLRSFRGSLPEARSMVDQTRREFSEAGAEQARKDALANASLREVQESGKATSRNLGETIAKLKARYDQLDAKGTANRTMDEFIEMDQIRNTLQQLIESEKSQNRGMSGAPAVELYNPFGKNIGLSNFINR